MYNSKNSFYRLLCFQGIIVKEVRKDLLLHVLLRYGEVTPDSTKFWSVLCECARPYDDLVFRFSLAKFIACIKY